MRKNIYFIFCTLMLLLLILGGCASNHDASASSEMQTGDTTNEESTKGVSVADIATTPTLETLIYEYETQELYARRDKNQIYGLLYIPKNAGEKMPAVIFSHGFGGNYQFGAQYAEALAQKGYVSIVLIFVEEVREAGAMALL